MKKWIALIAMLTVVLMLSGCSLLGYDAELDGAQVVAKVNDTEITKAEWQNYRDYLVSYYQQYYQQYFGVTFPVTDEELVTYGETALEQMIESAVVQDKLAELGYDPLGEEDAADVEAYADSMLDFYKMMIRYQNYPDVETVEEEQARLAAQAEATPSEATPAEPVATLTDAELDEMLLADLAEVGYTREYFVSNQTASVQSDKLYAHVTANVTVSDDEVKAEFDSQVAEQKERYDETPTLYAANEDSAYYVPAGYRGVKNLLIKITDEAQEKIDTLSETLDTAQDALADASAQLEELKGTDVSEYDEETLAAHNEQIAALEEQVASAQATVEETEPALAEATEAAYAEILPLAEEVLAKAQAGEDFDALVETYGEDTGMKSEPQKSRGYLVCDGLTRYEQSFQDAAMALAQVGDLSTEPVKSTYGYHILQYATDVEAGEVEFTEEIQTAIHDDLLEQAQDAAYDAAVTQWISEATVKTYPKLMK